MIGIHPIPICPTQVTEQTRRREKAQGPHQTLRMLPQGRAWSCWVVLEAILWTYVSTRPQNLKILTFDRGAKGVAWILRTPDAGGRGLHLMCGGEVQVTEQARRREKALQQEVGLKL